MFCLKLKTKNEAFDALTANQNKFINESGKINYKDLAADEAHYFLNKKYFELVHQAKNSALKFLLCIHDRKASKFGLADIENLWDAFLAQYEFIFSVLVDHDINRPINQSHLTRTLIFHSVLNEVGCDIFSESLAVNREHWSEGQINQISLSFNPNFHSIFGITEVMAYCFSKQPDQTLFESELVNLKILKGIFTNLEKLTCPTDETINRSFHEITEAKKIIKKQIDLTNVIVNWREEVKRCLDLEIRANLAIPSQATNSELFIKEILIRSIESIKSMGFKAFSNFDDTLKPILKDEFGKYLSSDLAQYKLGSFIPRVRGAKSQKLKYPAANISSPIQHDTNLPVGQS